MGRVIAFIYGLVAYVIFLVAFLYAIGFVGNRVVPKGIDTGKAGPLQVALLVNFGLLGIFAVQHSVMARLGFKRWWARWVPRPIERSTYVLLASLALLFLYKEWRPLPDVIWIVQNGMGQILLHALFWSGWIMVLISTFLIDHFDLFGLRQVYLFLRGRTYTHPPFKTKMFYKHIRHPLMLGFIIAFWATPFMSVGHFLFAAVTTVYVLIAIQLEERDIGQILGDDYRQYRKETPMLIPFLKRRK